jgi:hypothetical protein
LIRQRSLKRRLLIGPRSIEGAADVELTSLKLGSNIRLLTGNVRSEHIRSQRLTLLLGSEKLLINLLGQSDVLHRPFPRSARTGKRLTGNGRIVSQTTGSRKALTGALRSRPDLLRGKLAGGRSTGHPLSLQRLRQRALLLGLKSLLIEGLTKSPSANLTRLHLSGSNALRSRPLRGKNAPKLNLLRGNLLRSEPTHRRHSFRTNGLSLGSLHRKPPHLVQIATSLTPTHRLGLSQSRRHLRISSQISVTGLRGIRSKLGKTKLSRLRLKALTKRRLTASRHIS